MQQQTFIPLLPLASKRLVVPDPPINCRHVLPYWVRRLEKYADDKIPSIPRVKGDITKVYNPSMSIVENRLLFINVRCWVDEHKWAIPMSLALRYDPSVLEASSIEFPRTSNIKFLPDIEDCRFIDNDPNFIFTDSISMHNADGPMSRFSERIEKNWCPITHHSYIYSFSPTYKVEESQYVGHTSPGVFWPYGEIRGSSQVIPWKNGWGLVAIHSRYKLADNKAIYVCGLALVSNDACHLLPVVFFPPEPHHILFANGLVNAGTIDAPKLFLSVGLDDELAEIWHIDIRDYDKELTTNAPKDSFYE
jgi:hypothetical protein